MKLNRAIYLVLVAIMQIFFFLNCKKEATKTFPSVTTAPITNITGYAATSGGEVISDGGSEVTARGVCWSTNQNPTIVDNKTSDGTGSGSFNSSLTGLTPGSTYYIRAYANNNVGTAYGNQVSMTTELAVQNDYLPLTVGAKYKYNYSARYGYLVENSIKKGECIWKFISKSADTPVVYQVEQSFKGDSVYYLNYGSGPVHKDTTHFENQITALSFEVLNDGKVTFHFPAPYFSISSNVTFERFIQSDKIDTCFQLKTFSSGCLKKNTGITNLEYVYSGIHYSSVSYTLIEGPY